MTGPVVAQSAGARRDLILSRPETGNCLSEAMVDQLMIELDRAQAEGVALVTLRGAGRHFCTGFDLSDLETVSDERLLARFIAIEGLLARIWSAPFDTLALAQGQAVGAGADLFVACRRRLALAGTGFAFPGAAFGLVLGTRRLGLRIGRDRAADLIRSGRRMDLPEALDCGLVHHAVDDPGQTAAWLQSETARATRLDAATARQIEDALPAACAHGLDRDLAALVRSAARPGLGARIRNYRVAAMAARRRNQGK